MKYDDPRLKMSHLGCALVLHFQPRVHHISMSTHSSSVHCRIIGEDLSYTLTKRYLITVGEQPLVNKKTLQQHAIKDLKLPRLEEVLTMKSR